MRPRFRPLRLVAGLLVLLLLGSAVAPAAADSLSDLQRLQDQQDANRQRLEEIQRQKAEKERLYRQLTNDFNSAEQRFYQVQQDLADLAGQLQATQQQEQQAKAALAEAQSRLDKRTGLLLARLRAMSELGPVSYLEVLFRATSFDDFLTRYGFLKLIVQKDADLFRQLQAERDLVARKKAEITEAKNRLVSLRDATAKKKDEVQVAALEVGKKREATQREKELLGWQEDQLLQVSAQLADQIATIQAKLGRKRTGKLQLIWPVRGPITSPFGMRWHPILHIWKGHTGLDIAVSTGVPIKAAESGVIINSGWIEGYGYTTIIDHGDGVSTLYGHASKLLTRVGQEVERGQTIALVGSTGWSTGPHVHFEVRVNGTPQNPIDWLP